MVMNNKSLKYSVLTFAILVVSVFLLSFVSAVDCWSYSTSSQCTTNGCNWKNDSWNPSGWCEQYSCWSLNTQDSCSTTTVPGKNCTWSSGGTTNSCDQISCWSFSGTNANSCVNNSESKACTWSSSCYSVGGTSPGVDCWSINSQPTCSNTTGCAWGQCQDVGCWNYNSGESACNAGKDWKGLNCTWSSTSSYCTERNCWNYNNQTGCNAVDGGADDGGLACEWKWGSCQEKNCYSFDYTNETACVNNTISKSCSWSNGYCNADSCWSATSNSSCSAKTGCQWKSWTSSGWCSEVNCWTWDSMGGGNSTLCEDNEYGLNCQWSGNPSGNLTNGWCYQDYSSTTCSNITTEFSCYATNYCWWQANNWNDATAGGNCTNPDWGAGGYSNASITNEWNPGCYIFDANSTKCNNILGCNYSNGLCDEIASGSDFIMNYSVNITNDGLKCGYINDSNLCNNIASLSSCCAWQNGTCAENRISSSCWNQLDQTPNGETSCEDADTSSDCNTIAGDPWYMPCSWDNSSNQCKFKTSNVFGNGTQSLIKIENQKNCEAAGGKWVTENYCEGTVSISAGRCEYKFDEETNCNKACFACENYDSNGDRVNATNAASACTESKLGFCEFSSSSNAPNGIGFCKAKEQFKKGIAVDCNANCGDCSFLGNKNSNSTQDSAGNCLTASCFCTESNANSAGGGCKWISDNATITGGYCLQKGEKTCEDSCDRCGTRDECSNDGRIAISNQSGSCKWQGDDNNGDCVANIAGDVEVCWNGEDDDGDNLIDCADAGCYGDSFCGLVSGTCSGWSNNNTCLSNGCEWVSDKWGSWCDFKGSQCWKYDSSETSCNGATQVSNATLNITAARLAENNINKSVTFSLSPIGTGIVSGSVVITNVSGTVIDAGNYSIISLTAGTINFTNTTFMVSEGGAGNITNISYQYYAVTGQNCLWSNGTGSGWCEQDWSVGEECMGINNVTLCTITAASDGQNCSWTNDTWCSGQGATSDWCATGGGGWCDHPNFAPKNCWQNYDNSSCSGTSGCSWSVNEWSTPHCEVNWSNNCGQYNSTTCEINGCLLRNDTWGSWCDNSFSACWSYSSESTCSAVSGGICSWKNYGGGGGICEASCYSLATSSGCTGVSGCVWIAESGWCQEQQSQTCFNSTNSNSESNCNAASGCKWNNPGWCSPKDGFSAGGSAAGGGGGGGSIGGDCYKYNGNQTLCTDKDAINISCGWSVNQNPSCEPNWATNCWQYNDVAGGCNATNGCWFKNDSFGSWCGNLVDQCWNNITLVNNATLCNENSYCNSTGYGCSSACSEVTTSGACSGVENNACKWVSGWCNPAGMNQIFEGMEGGAPVPISGDVCDGSETNQQSVDICGLGMKDMGNSYGFGVNVRNFVNASVCNKEKVSTGGFGVFGGSQVEGNGDETVKYTVYLDTDGSTSDGCALDNNVSAKGYEFKLRYASVWNANTSKASETSTSYKCDNSQWKVSDLKISTWKKIMCSDIGGPMIAVEKAELQRFPTLYVSTADMRVYAITTNNVTNLTSPSDTVGPGWTTPGSADFVIKDMFSYDTDFGKFGDYLSKGYSGGEDCFTSIDDDNNGLVNCDDYDCKFAPQCASTGVNAANYIDTSAPLVTGVRKEEYHDATLIMFDTNKPTNGTVEFYKDDSTCTTLNKSVYDLGITSANVMDYRIGHKVDLYDSTLGYALSSDTKYYYKLKVCDDDGKCSISKCSSFTTALSSSKSGFENFVTRIKTPSDWTVSYDVNRDGTYEHIQGAVCGSTAGMKSNYTMRNVSIKLEKNDGSTYFEFIGASLSKTGLNSKVGTVNNANSFIATSAYTGLDVETRDKIVNNLNPEVCRAKIPKASDGSCSTLQHCDDNGANCQDSTAAAGGAPIDAVNCVWNIPNCLFSTYRVPASSGSSGSSGGGGGGGATGATIYSVTETQLISGYTKEISKNDRFKLIINNETHYAALESFTATTATINVSSNPQRATLSVGEEKKFELTSDNYYDLSVKLNSINMTSNKTSLTIKKINEKVSEVAGTGQVIGEPGENSEDEREINKESKIKSWMIYGLIGIVILIVLLYGFYNYYRNKRLSLGHK